MTLPYYTDSHVTLHHGQALDVLSSLPSGSVDCVVTSPPYFGLRDYGVAGQIGAEASPAEFVAALVTVFAEARRVLADDGTLWLNLGDSYSTYAGNRGASTGISKGRDPWQDTPQGAGLSGDRPAKNLLGIPWRAAFALQDDGWILRNDIIWAKPNGMPESVTDRLSTKHEHLFLFAKSRRYWFDLDAVREEYSPDAAARRALYGMNPSSKRYAPNDRNDAERATSMGVGGATENPLGRNPCDVWTIPTQPFAEAHFAVFPLEIPRRAIAAGCKPGGVVLDPFSGSGTTGKAAAELGRRYVGIDLNREYLDLSLRTRLAQPSLTTEASA